MVKLFIFIFITVTLCWEVRSDIVRPCRLSDYKCIRDNLAANSNCSKNVKGYINNPYTVERFRFEAPSFNSSYIERNLIVRNHNRCFISEFFVNRRTRKIVLSIDCPNMDLESDRELISHQSKKEDTYYNYHIRAVYPLVRLTINLSSNNNMDLCQSHVFSDVTALPKFHVNPKDKPTASFLTKDLTMLNIFERETFYYTGYALAMTFVNSMLYRATANFLSKDLSLLNIFERENWYYRGFPVARIFINNMICDYGCYPHILE